VAGQLACVAGQQQPTGKVRELPAEQMDTSPFIDMTSGYFERSRATLPLQGDRAPWRLQQHYLKDSVLFRGPTEDAELEFQPRRPAPVS
jgi:hypothetical protein